MPANSNYTAISTDEQAMIINTVSDKLGVDPGAIQIGDDGRLSITVPEGVDASKVVASINEASDALGEADRIPESIATLDNSHVVLQIADVQRYAGKQIEGPFGKSGAYDGASVFEDVLTAGGLDISDQIKAKQPVGITGNKVAANISESLGIETKSNFGAQFSLNTETSSEGTVKVTDLLVAARDEAGIPKSKVGFQEAGDHVLINGSPKDVQEFIMKIEEQGIDYRAAVDAIQAQYPSASAKGATRAEAETGKNFVLDDDGKFIEVGADGKPVANAAAVATGVTVATVNAGSDVLLGGTNADRLSQTTELSGLQQQLAAVHNELDVVAVEVVDKHLANGYVVSENTKTKRTNIAFEAIAESLGVKITKDGDVTKEEIQALQEKVGAKKNSKGEFDGIIGDDTLAQIKKTMANNKVSVAEGSDVSPPTTAAAATKSKGAGMDMA